MAEVAWSGRLAEGEQLRWTGAPKAGIRVTPTDLAMSAFGLFFTGVSLVFVVASFPFGLLLPHLWVGLYLLVGRYWVEARMRSAASYAVTDRRALIVRTWPTRKFTTVNLDRTPEVTLAEHRDGTGTITLGGSSGLSQAFSWGRRTAVPSFQYLEQPHQVLALLQPTGPSNQPPGPSWPAPVLEPRPPIPSPPASPVDHPIEPPPGPYAR